MTQELKQEDKTPSSVSSITLNDDSAVIGVSKSGHAFGSNNPDFIGGLAQQLLNMTAKGSKLDEKGVAFAASIIAGIHPKDQIEAMLAAQMAALHNGMMTFARRLNGVETLPQQDSAARVFNQLGRTFAGHVEALKRYRTGGNQNVVVKHIHIHEGGQAIVGNVKAGGRDG